MEGKNLSHLNFYLFILDHFYTVELYVGINKDYTTFYHNFYWNFGGISGISFWTLPQSGTRVLVGTYACVFLGITYMGDIDYKCRLRAWNGKRAI